MTDDYDLTKSSKVLGQLYPILKDKRGNIIDGFHRQNADPDWKTVTLEDVDSDIKLELARLATNFCRRDIPETEMQQRIGFLIKNGMKPEEIAEQTGISISTIYRHMPQEVKDPIKVKAHLNKISDVTRQQNITNHDTGMPSKTNLVSCDHCKKPTHISKMRTLDLCPNCYERLRK